MRGGVMVMMGFSTLMLGANGAQKSAGPVTNQPGNAAPV
jgi:hypothetical protein